MYVCGNLMKTSLRLIEAFPVEIFNEDDDDDDDDDNYDDNHY